MSYQLQLDIRQFLTEYWQQKPCLIKAGFADFEDPIAAEILAGLALEEGVDARIVEHRQQQWQVSHGPFTEYEQYGEEDWTLLVQAVNEWIPEVQQLVPPFRFLPDWRIDDVMVSFATEGGGVGPHVDQYDVFIIQGSGERHWRVGERLSQDAIKARTHCPTTDLKLIEGEFTALIDAKLEAGDILYIPAGCPHEGIGLSPSMSYSVGFRAPNQAELLSQLADIMLQQDDTDSPRYRDPQAADYGPAWQLSEQQVNAVSQFLTESIASPQLPELIGRALSVPKRPLPAPSLPLTDHQLAHALKEPSMLLCRASGAKILINASCDQLYAAGEVFQLSQPQQAFARALAEQDEDTPATEYAELMRANGNRELLQELLQLGVVFFEQLEA